MPLSFWRVAGIVLFTMALGGASAAALAEEGARIKRKRPTIEQADRMVSDAVMNDSSLQKGDIVVTDRGFFVFEGLGDDGITNQFRRIPTPRAGTERLSSQKQPAHR